MNKELIDRVGAEMNVYLADTRLRSITQIGKYSYVFTFEGDIFRRLLVSIDPSDLRIYFIRRRDRDLKKLSSHRSLFAIAAERSLAGKPVMSANSLQNERILEITFGGASRSALFIQLTGTSSNMFVVDERNEIMIADRSSQVPGQCVGSTYSPPAERLGVSKDPSSMLLPEDHSSVSEALDDHFSKVDEEAEFRRLAESARTINRLEIKKAEKLIKNLENDLIDHGLPEEWKRFGDLLLANQITAKRLPGHISVVDYFNEAQPEIRIAADDTDSIPETAQKYFRRFTKARNAKVEVPSRLEKSLIKIAHLKNVEQEIEKAVEQKNAEYHKRFSGPVRQSTPSKPKTKEARQLSGIRAFVSTDGFEILVGRKSTDNDYLTQRIAHSRDTWMHAADYPGSHVVTRNANRKEIPHSTLIEAAQLAAFFSQGNKQPKAAVNYTEKKFVSKPKGSAPGLVRLASFKTLMVEPVFPSVEKKKEL